MSRSTNYKPRKFLVQFRQTYKGRPLRRDFSSLQGKELILQHIGWQSSDEPYPDEEMLMPAHSDKERNQLFKNYGLTWIASGDLIELKEK